MDTSVCVYVRSLTGGCSCSVLYVLTSLFLWLSTCFHSCIAYAFMNLCCINWRPFLHTVFLLQGLSISLSAEIQLGERHTKPWLHWTKRPSHSTSYMLAKFYMAMCLSHSFVNITLYYTFSPDLLKLYPILSNNHLKFWFWWSYNQNLIIMQYQLVSET